VPLKRLMAIRRCISSMMIRCLNAPECIAMARLLPTPVHLARSEAAGPDAALIAPWPAVLPASPHTAVEEP